jgi:uncharacterized protein (TIGR03084 family)
VATATPQDRLASLAGDLTAEHAALDERVAALGAAAWATPTPAEGWDITDCISHLAYFDGTAVLALTDPEQFREQAGRLLSGGTRPDVALGRRLGPAGLLDTWREARADLLDAIAGADPAARVPWYGPPMGLASFVSARIMETWAHGQDVGDAVWLPPVISPRLRHVCHIGVAARPYAFAVHGIDDPGDPVYVEALRPDGEVWSWGRPDSAQRLAGPAVDLALVFTQRRHVADTAIVAEGPTAELWLSVAQCFAGPAGPGRSPLTLSGEIAPDGSTVTTDATDEAAG